MRSPSASTSSPKASWVSASALSHCGEATNASLGWSGGSDVAVAAVKSMLAAANSAYDNFTKVAKQATEIAEANVAAATETAKGLAKPKKVA